jgi:hypothetical protein
MSRVYLSYNTSYFNGIGMLEATHMVVVWPNLSVIVYFEAVCERVGPVTESVPALVSIP